MSLPFRAIPGYHAEAYCSACESWSSLTDWNDDDDRWLGSSAVCPRCGQHHSPYDPPVRPTRLPRCVCGTRNGQMGCAVHRTGAYADTNEESSVTDTTSRDVDRWDAFTDEELLELRNGCELRWDQRALPPEIRDRAGALVGEINRERNARRRRYRGPGVYRGNVAAEGASVPEYEVYGVLEHGAERVIVVGLDPKNDTLVTVPMSSFERVLADDRPAYEWVRRLSGRDEVIT